ncbi:MAG: PqqD family protein [Methylococcales bacterium]|nr:PqqD family protein [Methylococcales bacterium]
MNYIDSIYGKYQHLTVQPCYRKARLDGTDFLIVMNDNLETFYLAATAKEIMETISAGIKVDDIYQKLQTEYEVDAMTLKSDIMEFLKDMQWKRVICLSA